MNDPLTALVRHLITELLRSDSEFDAFCINYFPTVYRQFSQAMDRLQKENVLIMRASLGSLFVRLILLAQASASPSAQTLWPRILEEFVNRLVELEASQALFSIRRPLAY